mgnify:CR=1 FL=1
MKFNQIKETALYVKDLDQTEAFYGEKLDLKLISKVEGRHVFFRVGSSVLLCFLAEKTKHDKSLPSHYGEGKLHIAFEVPGERYSEVKEEILSSGIEVEYEEEWGGQYQSFYFRDPDDHLLEIVPQGMWE